MTASARDLRTALLHAAAEVVAESGVGAVSVRALARSAGVSHAAHRHHFASRTGLLTAVYRMEFEGWSKDQAYRELRANGFGTFAATEANVYLDRFIVRFERGVRR